MRYRDNEIFPDEQPNGSVSPN